MRDELSFSTSLLNKIERKRESETERRKVLT
jgi:hypothetical protein